MKISGGHREWMFMIEQPTTSTDVEVWLINNGHKSEDALFIHGAGDTRPLFLVADAKLAKKLRKLSTTRK